MADNSKNNKNNKNVQQKDIDIRRATAVKSVKNAIKYFADQDELRTNWIESIPLAKRTPVNELLREVFPDRDGAPANDDVGTLKNPIYIVKSYHSSIIGTVNLSRGALEFVNQLPDQDYIDPLSVSAAGAKGKDARLRLIMVIRVYKKPDGSYPQPEFRKIFEFLQEDKLAYKSFNSGLNKKQARSLRESEASHEVEISPEMRDKLDIQKYLLENSSDAAPFLNVVDKYISNAEAEGKTQQEELFTYYLYDKQRAAYATLSNFETFNDVFTSAMRYLTNVDKSAYRNAIQASEYNRESLEEDFMRNAESIIFKNYVYGNQRILPPEDVPALLARLRRALFRLYIVQDLIDDPDVTDIKITDPYSIRVRLGGKAYLSDLAFIDEDDYMRFVEMLITRNDLNKSIPTQTFTDTNDANYILRFTITADYITANGFPILHIRKISRRKLSGDDLVAKGMFDTKIRKYLADCGKKSRGVVFAGPPGSGKTVALNWFLDEGYEDTAEILVIQENDELFSNKKGIIFEHVVNNPVGKMRECTLEDLGQMALVAGANVFVIGEAKGGEICSAITLSNSGCRTAMTIHSPSASETIDKMADLAMRGYATDYTQAKRMIKSFQTIVYLQDFKVQEIKEIIGFDENKKDMIYRTIYDRNYKPDERLSDTSSNLDITGEELYY